MTKIIKAISTAYARVHRWLTTSRRKSLYKAGMTLSALLVADGVLTDDRANLIGILLGLAFGVAHANVTDGGTDSVG